MFLRTGMRSGNKLMFPVFIIKYYAQLKNISYSIIYTQLYYIIYIIKTGLYLLYYNY